MTEASRRLATLACVVATAATVCGGDEARPPTPIAIRTPVAAPPATAAAPRRPPPSDVPRLVWRRHPDDVADERSVSDRVGGNALPRRWLEFRFCGVDGVPTTLDWFEETKAATSARPRASFRRSDVSTGQAGHTWWAFVVVTPPSVDARLDATAK